MVDDRELPAALEERDKRWYAASDRSFDADMPKRTASAIRARLMRRTTPPVTLLRLAAGIAFFVAGAAADHAWARRSAAHGDPRSIVFVLRAPDARQVAVVGDFNAWDGNAAPLVRHDDGMWSTSLRVSPGVHAYAYMIDGRTWTVDPLAPESSAADFGTPTSTLVVNMERGS